MVLEAAVAASGIVARASNSARPRRVPDVNMYIYIYIQIFKYSSIVLNPSVLWSTLVAAPYEALYLYLGRLLVLVVTQL